jgi:hypothetical protein
MPAAAAALDTLLQCTANLHCDRLAAAGVLGPLAKPNLVECKAMRCLLKPDAEANSTTRCSSTADCAVGVCQSSTCTVQCTSKEQCASSAKALGLSAAAATCQSGRCVECSSSIPCPANTVFPDARATCQSGKCVECAADGDCARFQTPFGPGPVCVLGKCAECGEQKPCPAGLFGVQGSCQDGRCVECDAQKACPTDASKPGGTCLTATAKCVQCTADAQCGGKGPCMMDYSCQECSGDGECPVGSGVFPGAVTTCQNGKCTECAADEDCAKFQYRFGPKPFCSSGKCVECSSSRACPLGMHKANGTCQAGRCRECSADADCPKKLLTVGGICQTTPGVPSFGKCVECRKATDCNFLMIPGKSLICAAEEGGCEVCMTDQDCVGFAGVSGLGPYCQNRRCLVKGRSCSTAADCSYSGSCYGMAECPTPTCVAGECDSGLSGLGAIGLGV